MVISSQASDGISYKASHVRVVARIRPMSPEEQAQRCTSCINVIPSENDPSAKQSPVKKKGPFAFLTPNKRNKDRPPLGYMNCTTTTTPVTKNISQKPRHFQLSPSKSLTNVMAELPTYGSSTSLLTSATSKSSAQRQFDFDAVLDEYASQEEVYVRAVGDAVTSNIYKGYNTTILAYGQTGSGKTYTMAGPSKGSDHGGIVPRAVHDLFHGKNKQDGDVTITLTYMEIYNDEIRDLLSEQSMESHSPLKLRDHGDDGIVVDGLQSVTVKSETKVLELIEVANSKRVISTTTANLHSSRSHAICTLTVTIFPWIKTNDVIMAKLVLVDLAGSERIKVTGVVGLAKQESISINKDLFVLAKVVSALAEQAKSKKKVHVPYRDSKLTRLLRESLGGSCHTVMVACMSPTSLHLEESINTLRYAERTRAVCNSLKINVVKSHATPEFVAIQNENNMLKSKLSQLELELNRVDRSVKSDDAVWKEEYNKLLAAADDFGLDLIDAAKSKDQRDAIFRTMTPAQDFNHGLRLSLDPSFNTSIFCDDPNDGDSLVVNSLNINQRMAKVEKLDLEIENRRTQLKTLQEGLSRSQSISSKVGVGAVATNHARRLLTAPDKSSNEIELPNWRSNTVTQEDTSLQQEEHEQLKAEKEATMLRIIALEGTINAKQQQIHILQDQLTKKNELYYQDIESSKRQLRKMTEQCDLYQIQCVIHIDEVKRLQQNLMNSVSRETLEKVQFDLDKAKADNQSIQERLNFLEKQPLQATRRAVATTNRDSGMPEIMGTQLKMAGDEENNPDVALLPESSSFDDATIESDGADSQASSHAAIRIHAAKMLFWANKAIERGKTSRGGQSSVCSSISGDGSDFKPNLRALHASTAAAHVQYGTEKAPIAGKPPRALPRPSDPVCIVTGVDKVANDAKLCQCQGSAFSGNVAHVAFFLPKLGMACSCGMQKVDKNLDSKDPTNLENILRPWQVEFLKSIKILRAEDLVYQHHRRADALAKAMRHWRKVQQLPSINTKTCGIALHIWNRTCKMVVRSIQTQREQGIISLKKPDVLEFSISDNQTMSTIGWVGSEAIEIGSITEL